VLVETDDMARARDAFTQAVEVYEALRAEADVNRVLAGFRSYGIRRGPHGKHRKAQSGWDSLTDMELKVASFVEEGLSNPDIAAKLMLSRRTVGTHVSHILKKLDVASRPTSRGSRLCARSPPGSARPLLSRAALPKERPRHAHHPCTWRAAGRCVG